MSYFGHIPLRQRAKMCSKIMTSLDVVVSPSESDSSGIGAGQSSATVVRYWTVLSNAKVTEKKYSIQLTDCSGIDCCS